MYVGIVECQIAGAAFSHNIGQLTKRMQVGPFVQKQPIVKRQPLAGEYFVGDSSNLRVSNGESHAVHFDSKILTSGN
jgi:hypothetical protein